MMRPSRWFHKCLAAMSFLIGGLFLAPVYSEAGTPSITVNGVTIQVGGSSCNAAEAKTYTRCHPLLLASGGTRAGGVLVTHAPNATAKLLVADKGGGNLDLFTLSGVSFAPTASTGQSVTTTVVYRVKLDTVANSTPYSWSMRIGGFFQAGDGTTVNDSITISSSGQFGSTSTVTTLPPSKSFTVGNTTGSSFSLKQDPVYPSSACSSICVPTIIQTLTFRVTGPDKLVLTNSFDGAGGSCNLSAPDPGGPPLGTPAIPCKKLEQHQTNFLNKQEQLDQKTFRELGLTPAVPCTGSDCPPPPPSCGSDDGVCHEVTISKSITCYETCSPTTFEFTLTPEYYTPGDPVRHSIRMNGGSPTEGGEGPEPYGETQSITVWAIPGSYSITEDSPSGWELTFAGCNEGYSTSFSTDSEDPVSCHFNNDFPYFSED